MRLATLALGVSLLIAVFALGRFAADPTAAPPRPADDKYLQTALDFALAAYVKDWDGAPWLFLSAARDTYGSYPLRNENWQSSKAFTRLSRSWNLYFNEIRSGNRAPLDAQILTGSRLGPDNEPVFVVAFRGSDKLEDYLFTNCKNGPVAWEGLTAPRRLPETDRAGPVPALPYIPGLMAMAFSTAVTWATNFVPSPPVFAHHGYTEQVLCALSAKIVDPRDGKQLTLLEALAKYPAADFIITGHSSGGSAAQILSALIWETGEDRGGRIHTRTFAAAGSFNCAGRVKYSRLDSVNYVNAADPILFLNGLTGYEPLGVNVLLPALPKTATSGRTAHEMTVYEDQLAN